ncbi:MAG: hypothetical protein ACI8T1_001222 [Verrucomicrobiales bacterium]|jgi:hypothetical protein
MKSLFLLLYLFLTVGLAHAEILADSEADFPSTSEQGVNGWTYGYRLVDPDSDNPETYDGEADFIAFDEADGWIWNGTQWDWGNGDVPWTAVAAVSGHPNGTNSGTINEEHWVIRRWTAAVGPKPLALSWHLHKNNTNGAGTSVSINLNGQQVDYGAVEGGDDVGIDQTVYVNVNPGDHIDIALTPVGPTDDRGDGSDGSSWSAEINDTIPANPMQPDGTPFVAVSSDDSDNDDLPDAWERLFAEDLGTLSGSADTDSDNLTDLQEFEASLDPTDPDSDNDGLLDGDEIAGGTNPRKVDTDGNGLSDSQELIVDDIMAAKVGDSIEEFSGEQGLDGWLNGYRDYTADGGGENYDAESGFIPYPKSAWTGGGWDLDEGANGAPWTFHSAEGIHPNGTNNGPEHWAIRRWTADEIDQTTPLSILWKVAEQNLDGTGVTGSLHINGVQVDKATIPGGDEAGLTRLYFLNAAPGDVIDLGLTPEGANNDRNDGADGSFSWMIVSTFVPENAIQPDGSTFIPATGDDSDNDKLPDAWERQFFPNDLTQLTTGSDLDNDRLNDESEFLLGTNPNLADTDSDGLLDGAESGNGKFIDASAAGSSPLIADTDGDGLSDAEEANGNPVTNPNKADSDSDGFSDPEEIADGFDPNDPDSNKFATLIADSIAEFSEVQGENGWTDGYRDLGELPEEAPVDYDPVADFIPYPQDWWSGVQWDEPNDDGDNIPWTSQADESAHPNGTNSGGFEHWAIRRWVAEKLSDPQPLAIRYHLRATNANGTGTTVQLHINGELKDAILNEGNDIVGEERVYYANVNPGDFIDLALTPVGVDDNRSDGSDGSAFWMRVDGTVPDNATQPDGSTFVPLTLGDPHLGLPFKSPFGLLGDNPGVQERTITLKNSGSANDLTITAATLTGSDKDHFTTDLTLPLTLTTGVTQDVTITFDPQGQDGGFIAALEVASNDENKPTRTLDLTASIPDPNKLVAWYKMDETTGTRLDDSSGNGNHGTYLDNGATITLAQPGIAGGTAVRFAPDGDTAAYAEIPNFPIIENGFSISLWFQADVNIASPAGLISKNDGADGNGRPYALASSGNQLNWFGEGIPDIDGDNSPVTPDQTQHVAVTYDPATLTVNVYLDGFLTETREKASEITDVRTALQIGAVNGNFGFNGLIDDVQIYGKIISAEEAAQLQADPGRKLGGGDPVAPESNSDFRESPTSITKTGARVSINTSAAAYNVEYSEDLVTWEVIVSDASAASYEDSDATRTSKSSGYYRLRE